MNVRGITIVSFFYFKLKAIIKIEYKYLETRVILVISLLNYVLLFSYLNC